MALLTLMLPGTAALSPMAQAAEPSANTGMHREFSAAPVPAASVPEPAATAADGVETLNSETPLSFDFIRNRPGRLISLGSHRLHVRCFGLSDSDITVWFEAGLGGNALEWEPVMEGLASAAQVCSYDRAGYAWSDPSALAHDAEQLAREADLLLRAAGIDNSLVLVGHSFGGFINRLLLGRRAEAVVGMVLIDSSHEGQFERFERNGARAIMPTSRQFVISANDPPKNLPHEIRKKVEAFGRMRKSYTATHAEMASFRRSANQVAMARTRATGPMDVPLVVIRRGLNVYGSDEKALAKSQSWQALQEDLVGLSRWGRMVVAERSGHHIHADQPELVVEQIRQLLRAIRDAD